MKKNLLRTLLEKSIFLLWIGLIVMSQTALLSAHDFRIDDLAINGTGENLTQWYTHDETNQNDYKGWVDITVKNNGETPWGDFHFNFFQVGSHSIDNLYFDITAPNQPQSSQGNLSWQLSANRHSLDLFFYDDPLFQNDTANFRVYTDNTTDRLPFFGLSFYPTPVPDSATVPIPGAIIFLFSGLASLWTLKKING